MKEMIFFKEKLKWQCQFYKPCPYRGEGCYNVEKEIVDEPVHCANYNFLKKKSEELFQDIYLILPYSSDDSRYLELKQKYLRLGLPLEAFEEIEDKAVLQNLQDEKEKIKDKLAAEKRNSLRKIVSKIFKAQPLQDMKPEIVSGFIGGNFDTKIEIEPEVIKPYLSKNDINSLIDYVVDEMMKEAE